MTEGNVDVDNGSNLYIVVSGELRCDRNSGDGDEDVFDQNSIGVEKPDDGSDNGVNFNEDTKQLGDHSNRSGVYVT
jgi:CRP-like cAMP-binding protein